jgi:hypothetical protein
MIFIRTQYVQAAIKKQLFCLLALKNQFSLDYFNHMEIGHWNARDILKKAIGLKK